MTKWNQTKPHRVFFNSEGVYTISTSSGKLIYSYGRNPEDIHSKVLNSLSPEDKILSIHKERL